jgi:hypothetical protein
VGPSASPPVSEGLCARFGGLGRFAEDLAKIIPLLPRQQFSWNNSHAQANSGFRLLRSYTICLYLEEAFLGAADYGYLWWEVPTERP